MKEGFKIFFALGGCLFCYFLGSQNPESVQEEAKETTTSLVSPKSSSLGVNESLISFTPSIEKLEKSLKEFPKQEIRKGSKSHLPFLKVISVHDGDSIKLLTAEKKQLTIRLEGIDAPELGQEYGRKSKEGLGAILKAQGGHVYMDMTGTDKYGRTLAKLYLPDERDVNEVMISNGYAWHFKKYNDEPHLNRAEKEARSSKSGLWGLGVSPISPWDFRAKQKELAFLKKQREQEELRAQQLARERASQKTNLTYKKPESKKVKVDSQRYWINSSSGVRHNRGCRWHGETKRGYYSSEPKGRGCGICGG